MFTAKEAKDLTNKSKTSNLNHQRIRVLNLIKGAAKRGWTSIPIDDPLIYLYDEDWNFFIEQGYTVQKPYSKVINNERTMFYFGVISW